ERERLGARLLHESHRVSRVVDDLLALSEIEGEIAPRREPVACAEVVRRVEAEVAVLADGFGVEVDTSAVDEDLWVVGDVVQLASAVGNLVENAIKYSGGSTEVSVAARAEDRFVRITVTDRGIGIPRGDLDRVFERFYRVDQARSRATGGTGLGLAIVRNVVEGHGGTVDLTSREGEGTTVDVRLPLSASRSGGGAGEGADQDPMSPTGASA
ncbi:MAG: ATP-binding protein, partial [Actinomycetota bacterium]